MEPHVRHCNWLREGLGPRITFSSCSRSRDDIWARDIERPYQIALLPGYTIPKSLDLGSNDSLWPRDGVVYDKPRIVWDGFSVTALFEVIYECFDPSRDSPYIIVRDAKTGEILEDPRDPRILAVRPRRTMFMGDRARRNHIVELSYWADILPSGDETQGIYGDLLGNESRSIGSTDSYTRYWHIHQCGMTFDSIGEEFRRVKDAFNNGTIRLRGNLDRGIFRREKSGAREEADKDVPLFETNSHATLFHAPLTIDDVERAIARGDEICFYRLSAEKGNRIHEGYLEISRETERSRNNK